MSAITTKLQRAGREIRRTGLSTTIRRVYRDWRLGRQVEAQGDRIDYRGVAVDVSNPIIRTRMKSTFMTGDYERPELDLVERFLPGDLPVVEFGESIGVVACFTNRRLAHPERHVVVEANPQVMPSLTRNAALNGCRFTVEQAALAYGRPSVTFYQGSTFLAGSLRSAGGKSVEIPAVTLVDLLDRHGFPRADVIADIEGAEAQLIENEAEVLRTRVRWMIFEHHPGMLGMDRVQELLGRLEALGFVRRGEDDDVVAMENGAAVGAGS